MQPTGKAFTIRFCKLQSHCSHTLFTKYAGLVFFLVVGGGALGARGPGLLNYLKPCSHATACIVPLPHQHYADADLWIPSSDVDNCSDFNTTLVL